MKSIKVIKNPKQPEIKLRTTSVILSRRPKIGNEEFKTAVIYLYDKNNAHKIGEFPTVQYEFNNVEKVRIKGLNCSYYLEGNDIVINDLEELFIIHQGTTLILKGYQYEVELRKNKK